MKTQIPYSPLTAISPIDGRYEEKTSPLRQYASEYALMKYRLFAEIRWIETLCYQEDIKEAAPLNEDAQELLDQIVIQFDVEVAQTIKSLEKTTQHDIKAIEYYLKAQFEKHNELKPLIPFIHFGCTSEDINSVAYALMLRNIREHVMTPPLDEIINKLTSMAHEYANIAMLAHTHGQPATPTTLGKEFAVFVSRLKNQYHALKTQPITAKCNGATGNFNAHVIAYPDINWEAVSEQFIRSFGLEPTTYTTQIEPRDNIAALLQAQMRLNTIFVDFSRDMWHYISLGYLQQKSVDKEVGSSTMPHKVNPIHFENAEGNLGLANAMMAYIANTLPISRLQRDLSGSTVLRNLGASFAYALIALKNIEQGLEKLVPNTTTIEASLTQHPEVIAEAIQTVMRRHGHTDAYEQLKSLTRGQPLSQETLKNWIKKLDLPDQTKKSLLHLSSKAYVGLAEKLAKSI